MDNLLFASASYKKYSGSETLPAKFKRLLEKTDLADKVKGKTCAVKMHVGRAIGYTTIHPLFVKTLIEKLKEYGARPFVTDVSVADAVARGYREEFLGCPVVDVCGATGKYYYEHKVAFKTFTDADVAGHIQDADFLLDLSHVKGHGCCGYGGASKNLSMGCVTDRTRTQIHGLEACIKWDEEKCNHCNQCIESCNHYANSFENGKYVIMYHHCTNCQHCYKVCPTGAISLTDSNYDDFQEGLALMTKTVLDTFDKEDVYYINFLTNITALCDCWGLSTPPLVPDIGIISGNDIVAIEQASLDMIKVENLLQNGLPANLPFGDKGHLFQRLHSHDPYIGVGFLEKYGLGSKEYTLEEVE